MHELVSKLKILASEINATPTFQQFYDRFQAEGVSYYQIKKHGFVNLLNAADLQPPSQFKKKIKVDASFEVSLEKQLDEFVPREFIQQPAWPKILCIGDAHFPFVSERALEKIYEFAEIHKPDYIVQMGDLYDFLAHSKFPRSHNVYSPQEEERLAREGAEEMFRKLNSLCPNAKMHLIIGNHDLRPLKRVLEQSPTVEHWAQKYWREMMTFEGVETQFDSREELEIAGILFTHGFLGKEGAHRDYYLKNVVIGHLHKLWVQYRRFHGHQCFELCTGFIGDPFSKALTYTPSKAGNYQLGFGWIDQFGARAIHL